MDDERPVGADELPFGVGYGAALVGKLGPCPSMEERCPIRPDELHAPEKCQLVDCLRRPYDPPHAKKLRELLEPF